MKPWEFGRSDAGRVENLSDNTGVVHHYFESTIRGL